MPKKLSVISINFPLHDASAVLESTLSTERAFFDFDVLVIRPHTLKHLVSQDPYQRTNPFRIDWESFNRPRKVVTGKIEDTVRLLENGGILVVILDRLERYECMTGGRYSSGTLYTVTNYDFLTDHFFGSVRSGSGAGVQYIDTTDAFSRAMKVSSVRWTAYLCGGLDDPFNSPRIIARNGPSSFVGATVQVGNGWVIFLPNFETLDEEAFFKACDEYKLTRERTQPPAWASAAYLPGEKEANRSISTIEVEISRLEDSRKAALEKRNRLIEFKNLLYEKGKFKLEPIVLRSLNLLGCECSGSEIIAGGFEIDGRTKVGPGILEVKGSRSQIGLDEFSSLSTKLMEDFKATGIQSKGILVGNGLCEKPPEDRLGDRVFAPHVLQGARTQSIALINSVELYWIICGLQSTEITDCEPIRGAILAGSGFVDLQRFCGESPFRANETK
jgi:hypothetical protein